MSIWVVTVTWNGIHDTCDCIESLYKQEGVVLEIVIVDNGSTDNAAQIIKDKYPTIKLIRSNKNLGFAGGYNLGIQYALSQGAENVLVINNDTILDPKMLINLHLVMASENISVTSPVIYYHKEPTKIWSTGGDFHSLLLEPSNSHNRTGDITNNFIERTFISGCCMLIKREVFEKVGFFDERFFAYYEDLDFCLRVKSNNYRMLVVPSAKLWHKVSISSGGEFAPKERYLMAFSSCLYFRKHLTFRNALIIIPYRIGSAFLWTVRLLSKRNWKSLFAYWQGIIKGITANPINESVNSKGQIT